MNTNEMTANGMITRIGIEYAKMMKEGENTDAALIGIAEIPTANEAIDELSNALADLYGFRIGSVSIHGNYKGEITLEVYALGDCLLDRMLARFTWDRDYLLKIAA